LNIFGVIGGIFVAMIMGILDAGAGDGGLVHRARAVANAPRSNRILEEQPNMVRI